MSGGRDEMCRPWIGGCVWVGLGIGDGILAGGFAKQTGTKAQRDDLMARKGRARYFPKVRGR